MDDDECEEKNKHRPSVVLQDTEIISEALRRSSNTMGRRPSMFVGQPLVTSKLKALLSVETSCLRTYSENPSDKSLVGMMKRPPTKYQNTYKLEPDQRFPIRKAERIAEEVLRDHLEDLEYNENIARRLVKVLSDKILTAVKALSCPRYKVVVIVNVGQLNGQGLRVGSRYLWQPQHDNFAEAVYEGKTIWSTATVFCVYQD